MVECSVGNLAFGFDDLCLLVPVNAFPFETFHSGFTPACLSFEVWVGSGQPLALEYTSEWAHWTTLATSTNLIGRRVFMDPDLQGEKFRAYRARLMVR